MTMPLLRTAFTALLLTLTVSAALSQTTTSPQAPLFPDVLSVKVRPAGPGVFDFDVTVSSPYDTARRYADGFRLTAPGGQLLGERKLWHDHQNEQPFTRDLHGVTIAPSIRTVTVQARDQISGYGGRSVTLALPGR